MADGVGPAAFAERANKPELTMEGKNRVVPLRVLPDYKLSRLSRDPRGFEVRGYDNEVAGKVVELWVDRYEGMVRFLEIDSRGKTVMAPLGFARINLDQPRVTVQAIKGEQFAKIPSIASKDQITENEVERIQAYFGGGYMYADKKRAEPLV